MFFVWRRAHIPSGIGGASPVSRRLPALAAAVALLVVLTARAVQAQDVSVIPTVTFDSALALYHYAYRVTNNTAFDLTSVSVSVFALPNTVLNPTAPAGFETDAQFVPDFGLLDFNALTDVFAAGGTVTGFAFDSPFAPNATLFTATGPDPNSLSGNVSFAGSTLGPAAVPEPGTLSLVTAAAALLGLALLRRRKTTFLLTRSLL